ncbi:diversity-generating retroelement protein Avd [Candidatus Parcubacteria bacterium]|nr:diversity-generating retroelement protein Avd [Candidatus Parcubacteria bacterium]
MQNLNQVQSEAPIIKKTVDLYKEFYQYLKIFPKKDQYMLGKRCEEHIIDFMELIVSAVSLYKQEKKTKLLEANNKFDLLKVLFRMARELKMLDNKKYLNLEEKIQEIGRMLGGWIRSLQ